jgi:hypothetical protein
MTIFFRKLSEIKQQTIEDAFELIKESFYKIEEVIDRRCVDVLVYPIFE